MHATSFKVQEFLSANKTQFIIPVYQRNYDWKISQCRQLFSDILDIGANDETNAHFIGSVVFVHEGEYSSGKIKELVIIDGQQRLTTLTLIYVAIYWLGKELEDEELYSEILETYLINKFSKDDNKLKLKPTENINSALQHILRNNEAEYSGFSRLIDNYQFFKQQINQENYQQVLNGLSKLMFVEISLDRQHDNPQRIFESLNSTGLALSQADLIRNYILMGLNRDNQTNIFKNYWEPIENFAKDEALNKSKVSDFIRDFLTLKNKKIPNKNKVYEAFKNNYPDTNIASFENELSEVKNLAKHYNKLTNPENEPDKDIQKQLKYIDKLEINVAFPFLIKVYDDYEKEIIDKTTFVSILEFIQSYVWRRFIVAVPTNALNKIFMNLYEKVDKDNYLESIQKSLLLRTGAQRFPKNSEVSEYLKTKDIYNIQSKNRTYLLERLENYNNNEPVIIENNPDITIEHIFPQNPDSKWKEELDIEEYNFIKDNYLNTIGNITLSGNNGKLGNKIFSFKKELKDAGYKDSRLWLNKYLANCNVWNIEEIEKRFDELIQRFYLIWEYPEINLNIENTEKEISIFEANDPTYKKLEYFIFFNQRYDVNQITQMYVEIFKKLFEIQPEAFFTSDLGSSINLSKNHEKDKLRQPVSISNSYFIETNIQNTIKFEKIKQALVFFGFEEELTLKYLS